MIDAKATMDRTHNLLWEPSDRFSPIQRSLPILHCVTAFGIAKFGRIDWNNPRNTPSQFMKAAERMTYSVWNEGNVVARSQAARVREYL